MNAGNRKPLRGPPRLDRSVSRRLLLIALSVALLVPSPLASGGHPPEEEAEAFTHITLSVEDLPPGETVVHHLLSPEGPLRAGWIYIIYGGVQGEGQVVVNLTHAGDLTDRFVWTGGAFHKNSTKIQGTGDHDLVLWNPTNDTVRYAFYYDQSCNCAGKSIPLPGGFVLFNNKFQAGREVTYDLFVYDEAITLKAALAAYDPERSTADWPEDFDILEEKTVSGKDWLNFTFTPEETATYYVFYEAVAGASPEEPVMLTPIIEVESDEGEAPASVVAWLFLALVLLVGAARRRVA